MKDDRPLSHKIMGIFTSLLAAAIFFAPGFINWSKQDTLLKEGVEVQATIIAVERKRSARRIVGVATYQFEYQGRTYEIKDEPGINRVGSLKDNQVILLINPKDPNKFAYPGFQPFHWVFMCIGTALGLAGVGFSIKSIITHGKNLPENQG